MHEQLDWLRVTKQHPCPVCARDHFCTVSPTGNAAMCTKVPSAKERDTKNGPAWIHILDERFEPPPPSQNGKHEIDWAARQQAFRSSVTAELRDELAGILGVEPMALDEIGVGWDGERETWTFPMHDDEGTVCGITWRNREGKKKHYTDSKVGLYRRTGAPDDGPVAIVEGASDTAATLSFGTVDVLGLPSASTVVDYLVPYVRNRPVIVIGDNDEGAGARSVKAVVAAVQGVAKSVATVFPPPGIKDVRAWRASNALWSDILSRSKVLASPPKEVETPFDVVERWKTEGPLIHELTGFPTLDKMTRGGFVYGTVTVWNGAPDASKTMAMTVMLDRFASQGIMVGILAVDEDSDGIVTRLCQRRAWARDTVEQRAAADLDRMQRDLAEISGNFVLYKETWSIEKAALDLHERAKAAGKRSVFVVDSLQTCHSLAEADSNSIREQVTQRMLALKSCASTYKHMVHVTSEMARAGYDDRLENKGISDMAIGKESGSIEYQGKVLISVRPEKDDPTRIRLFIAKNKIGFAHQDRNIDGILLVMDKAGQNLTEAEDSGETRETRAAKAETAKAQAAAAQLDKLAAKVAMMLAAKPGLGTREMRIACRKATGKSNSIVDDCLFHLGASVVQVQLTSKVGRRVCHYLDGRALPASVLNMIPLEDRPMVNASTPPSDGSEARI